MKGDPNDTPFIDPLRMFDHIGLGVTDLEASTSFFQQCLLPLGISIVDKSERSIAFGRGSYPEFWLDAKYRSLPHHIAFSAQTRDQVDGFYHAAIAAGAKDNGPPGIRIDYHPDYYAAFVIAPDGHNIEAVCRLRMP